MIANFFYIFQEKKTKTNIDIKIYVKTLSGRQTDTNNLFKILLPSKIILININIVFI